MEYFLLLFLIAILLIILLRPLIKRKFTKIKILSFSTLNDIHLKLLDRSILMMNSNKTFMSFNDEDSLYTMLAKLKGKLKGDKSHSNYTFYNFPKAFLLLGIIDSYKSINDINLLNNVISSIDRKYIDKKGNLQFQFDKIDQSLFGVVFIELFKITHDFKYKNASDNIYQEIQKFKNSQGLYLYRKNDNILFIDTLGMVVPFLICYGEITDQQIIIEEANFQLTYYTDLTTNNNIDFPCHGFDLINNLKLGSNNWSRGMGWYMIGLSFASRNNKELKKVFDYYYQRLENLSIQNYWPQFFGHSNDNTIDASGTIMIYYSASILQMEILGKINNALIKSISVDYFVENNSGDTIYINKYSRIKSKSELSQGLLLSILSKKNK